jgi:hypothetical protein
MSALDSPEVDRDQALEFEIGIFAAKMPQENVLGGDGRVGLELETPMAVVVLPCEQRLRSAGNVALERVRRRRDFRMVERDIHGVTPTARGFGATAPGSTKIEAAL